MTRSQPPVQAAGAVCWRVVNGRARVLLVHRPGHRDVSLPKGKLDPGETLPETAVREIAEETGLRIALGVPLGVVEYPLPTGRDKMVHYWAAEVGDQALERARFTPNDEISKLEWLDLDEARDKLSYPHDREVLDRFEGLLRQKRVRTFAIVTVRHGQAVPHDWNGPDADRPLRQRGIAQARGIAKGVAAYGPERLLSSPAVRCMSTLAPLSKLTGLRVKPAENISQDAYEAGRADVAKVVAKRLQRRVSAVLCSHGPVLPEILTQLAVQTGTPIEPGLRRAAALDTGEFTVVHISQTVTGRHDIVAVETHAPA
ncbi:MAG TPA: NUDIX hydrolase [Rhodoglobus sp.]|nr:NUDIX hydrolase [Rhodoglobus sp.]